MLSQVFGHVPQLARAIGGPRAEEFVEQMTAKIGGERATQLLAAAGGTTALFEYGGAIANWLPLVGSGRKAKKKVGELEEDLAGKTAEVERLTQDNDAKDTRISELEGDVERLTIQVEEQGAQIEDLNLQLGTMTDENTSLADRLATANDELAQAKASGGRLNIVSEAPAVNLTREGASNIRSGRREAVLTKPTFSGYGGLRV